MDASEERVVDLEIKLAFAERRIDDLDDVVRKVSETVDLLIKETARLRKLVLREDLPPGNVKPPHY
jgi:uncharacterized coiled-coil protein SlyX